MTLSRRNFLRSAGALVGIVAAEPVRRVFDMGANVRAAKGPAVTAVDHGAGTFDYGNLCAVTTDDVYFEGSADGIWMSSDHGFTYDTGSPQGTLSLEGSADGERWHGIDETGPIPERFVRAKWHGVEQAENVVVSNRGQVARRPGRTLDDYWRKRESDMLAAFNRRVDLVRGV